MAPNVEISGLSVRLGSQRLTATFHPYPFDSLSFLRLADGTGQSWLTIHNLETAYGDRLAAAINAASVDPATATPAAAAEVPA